MAPLLWISRLYMSSSSPRDKRLASIPMPATDGARTAQRGRGWTEVFLDPLEAQQTRTASHSLQLGHSVVLLHDLASSEECDSLRNEASAEAASHRTQALRRRPVLGDVDGAVAGRVRMPVVRLLGVTGKALCDTLLHRVVSCLDAQAELRLIPQAFHGCQLRSASFFQNHKLTYTEGEPAINVYTAGGGFKVHTDKHALTILVPLSDASAFDGGGTAFWSKVDSGPAGRTKEYRQRSAEPTLTLTPAAGTALLFGGTVVHAGIPVIAGERAVFVASFSPALRAQGASHQWTEGEFLY